MKRNIFIALAAFAICSSCSDSYYLPETEQDLAQLNSEYDDVKAKGLMTREKRSRLWLVKLRFKHLWMSIRQN